MYSRPDLDLLNFAFVCLYVGITSSIYEFQSDSTAHVPLPQCLRYSVVLLLECLYFLVEVFIKAMKVSVDSLEKAVHFHEFMSAVNSTNYSSYRVEFDNHPDNVLVR